MRSYCNEVVGPNTWAPRRCLLNSFSLQVTSFRFQLVKILTPILRQGIARLCLPEATHSFIWDGTGFLYLSSGRLISPESSRQLGNSRETGSAWSFPVTLFPFPRVASCLLRVTGSFRLTVKPAPTWLDYHALHQYHLFFVRSGANW